MSKLRKPETAKNFWNQLVTEVLDKKHLGQKHCPTKVDALIRSPKLTHHSVSYNHHIHRRLTKYALGEPLKGVYFTQREADCVIELMQGKTLNETGNALQLSPRTIEYYLGNIKRKLNCRKKREVIKIISETDFVKNFHQQKKK